MPTTTVTTVTTVTTIEEDIPPSDICECHKIDWSGGPGDYKYVKTREPVDQLKDTFSCQTKVNKGKMGLGTYEEVCQYIPGKIGTKFPDHVYKIMRGDAHATQTDP